MQYQGALLTPMRGSYSETAYSQRGIGLSDEAGHQSAHNHVLLVVISRRASLV